MLIEQKSRNTSAELTKNKNKLNYREQLISILNSNGNSKMKWKLY